MKGQSWWVQTTLIVLSWTTGLSALLLSPQLAYGQQVIDLTSSGECVLIGHAVWDGVGGRATLCRGDTQLIALRQDNVAGPLDANYIIRALAGADDIFFVPSNNYTAPTNCDCGVTGYWNQLQYNGYYLDVYAGDGNDDVDGPRHSGADTYIFGELGGDNLYNYLAVAEVSGGGGNDNITSMGYVGYEVLRGWSGDDCLHDWNNSYTTFDCGANSDRYYHTNTTSVNCETPEYWCCGFC